MGEKFIAYMTSASPEEGDSLHLIVMDLHREINALQSAVYQESVDGASVDRPARLLETIEEWKSQGAILT